MMKVSFFDLNVGWGGAEIFFRNAFEAMRDLLDAEYAQWRPWNGILEAFRHRHSDVLVINVSLLGVGFHRLIPFLPFRNKCVLYVHLANDHREIGSKFPLIRNALGRWAVRLFPNVIAISRGNGKLLGEMGRKSLYLPNFIANANDGVCDDAIAFDRMAIVGRICEKQKRQMAFVSANAKYIRERNLQLNFFGNGPDEQALRDLATTLGLQEHAVFHGWVSSEDIWKSGIRVVVSSSAFEAMPLNILEAVFQDRLVIATDVAGADELLAPEFLMDGVAGFPATHGALENARLGDALNRQKRRLFDEHNAETYRRRFMEILEGISAA